MDESALANEAPLMRILARRSVKLCLVYLRYSHSVALQPSNGFQILPLHDHAGADVVVVDKMSDVDMIQNDYLATKDEF